MVKKKTTKHQIIHIDEKKTIRKVPKYVNTSNGPTTKMVDVKIKSYNIFYIESNRARTKGFILNKYDSPQLHKIFNEYNIKKNENADDIQYLGVNRLSLSESFFLSLIKNPIVFSKLISTESLYYGYNRPKWTPKSFTNFVNKFFNINR